MHHLRQQDLPGQQGENVWARNYWLAGLNYLHVARAALDCSAYLSAIVYADIWDAIHCCREFPCNDLMYFTITIKICGD